VWPFPAVFQDVRLVVSAHDPAHAVADAVREGAGELLEDIQLFDVFTGSQIGAERKSLTFALRFRAGSHADRGRRQCGPRCGGTSRSGRGRRCIAPRTARSEGGPVRFGQNLGGAVAAHAVTVGQTLGIPPCSNHAPSCITPKAR
jgi:hypothetical protein